MSGTFFYQTFQDDTLTNLYESENGKRPLREWVELAFQYVLGAQGPL